MSDVYDEYLVRFEPQLRPVIRVLLEHENDLSDGYSYYAGQRHLDATLAGIAEELLQAAKQVIDRRG